CSRRRRRPRPRTGRAGGRGSSGVGVHDRGRASGFDLLLVWGRPGRRGSRGPRRLAPRRAPQYESALRTSPPALVPLANQVVGAIVSLMNLTEPAAMPTLTPPGWLLLAVIMPLVPPHCTQPMPQPPAVAVSVVLTHDSLFGVLKWV